MSKQLQIMEQILAKIKEYDRIIICRHKRPDGDAIGSSRGLCELIRASFPDKQVFVAAEDSSDYLSFLGEYEFKLADEFYKDALVIVVDTATEDRISNNQYKLAKEIIKIDHHIDIKPYGDLCWIEDWRSATCEMIAYFYATFADQLKLSDLGAKFIFTGLITDSGRFRYESTTGETLRLGALMLDKNIDTEILYANLYLEEFDYLKFQAYVYNKMKITPNGVAYLHVDKKMQRKFKLTQEQASEAVSFLKGIKGCIAWLAFIDSPDNTLRVRLRSRFMHINPLAEKYGGGGHQCTCGATLHHKNQIAQMVADADKMVAEYKSTNEGWL